MNTPEAPLPSASLPLPCRHLRCKEMFQQSPEDDAFAKVMKRYENKGKYRFTFDSGTSPAVK